MNYRSISFPLEQTVTRDEDGFETDVQTEWLGGVPALFSDLTRNDEMLAQQLGYSADQNVETDAANYSGQSFFVDEATGDVWDIRRTFRKNKARKVVLTAQRRERGKETADG